MAQYVYGKNVVKQMLRDGSKIRSICLAADDKEIVQLAEKNGISVKKTDRKALTRMTGTDRHQGIAALIEDYRLYTVDEMVNSVPASEYGLIIMLDELEDPHNLGAVLRTADAIGATGVIFKKTHAVGLTPTVAKVSAGAIDTVKCAAVTNLSRTLEDLKKKGYWAVAADMDGQDYRTLNYDFNTVLIIGNEGKGISRLLSEKCDYTVSLPMVGKISSLNASVSAGILMYSIYDRRNPVK
ncbi:MAG: 23S rRNA (guanosine(2251)-2'-O)-methyltransferase RlmB [Erysipelotrichaceae bacterium]|jgi:23S rRNA (guanosine2251-2'-O)-methyltransferase|nr:23S rRNA (guanosine(2251)-2'-O)-methyltransferase RlmB [Erysipelotrichaceae bacterium]